MPLSATTLHDELDANIDNFNTEAEAILGWATTFDNYFQEAMAVITPPATGIPVTSGTTSDAKAAMQAALAGLNTAGSAASVITTGITAYWGALSINAAAIFVSVPPAISITPPTGLGGLQVTLETVFTANIAGNVTKGVALTAIANAIHAVQIVGALCVFPVPPAGLGSLSII
jgi:hypothetical protein